MTAAARRWLPPLITFALMLAAWQVIVGVTHVPQYILPSPLQIWTAFGEVKGTLPVNIVTTFEEAALGLLLGAVAGALVAAGLWASAFARRIVFPLLVVSQTVPMVILAPLLVLWFGIGLLPKVLVVASITFFPVAVATVQGLMSTDADLVDLLRTMGAKKHHIAWLALVPSATAAFFAGVRISASYAVAGAVIGEWVGASSGLGLLTTRAQHSFRIDRVFVAVAIIALLSVALFLIVDALARLAMPWHQDRRFLSKGLP